MLPIINWDVIDEAKALMQDNFPVMVQYFLEDAASYISTIEEGLAQSDAEKIKSAAHTIKSSSKQLGAEKLSEIAMQIEHSARNIMAENSGDLAQIHYFFNELKAAFGEVEPALKELD